MFTAHVCTGCGRCPKYRAPREAASLRDLKRNALPQFGLRAQAALPDLLLGDAGPHCAEPPDAASCGPASDSRCPENWR